jgi:protein-S-isoprenylcysteine O-methyltransferase Ste14
MLLVVGAFPNPVLLTPPAVVRGISATLALGAFALGVYGLLYLRRSLSIIPEARRLVTGGPYRLIRHPLYAAEILAAFALVLARPGLWATLMLVPFIAVQMLRARFEEGLLSRIFPEYKLYAAHTPRLIPLVW